MHSVIFILSAYLLLQISPVKSYAQDPDIYFKKGMQAYIAGDLESAIENLEQAHKLSPAEEKIKQALSRFLALKGKKLIDAGKYQEAVDILGRAVKLGYEAATKDYRIAIAELEKLKEIERQRKVAKLKSELEELTGKKIPAEEEKPLPVPEVPEEKPRLLLPGLTMAFLTPEAFVIRMGAIVVILIIGVVLIVAFVKHSIKQRGLGLLYHQEKILRMMDRQHLLTEEDKKIIVTKGKNGYEQIITINPQARQRADRVELIEEALKDEKNPKIAEQLIAPFLLDPNNRVRANAAKAIYKHNKKAALKTLEEMTKSADKWMRVSAAWAIGEIKDAEFAVFLAPLLTDQDQHVRQKAIKSMENIISTSPPQVVATLQKRISDVVSEAPEKLAEQPKPAPVSQIDRLKELKEKLIQLRLGKK